MSDNNTLGLDFTHLESPIPTDNDPEPTPPKDKKKPYVNTERVKTGGSQRDKLSEEALAERMARMREQNEKIKQRRMDVKADEDAFRKTQESERVKLAHNRKVQEDVDRAREQNAKRKMDKVQSREWDSGKPTIAQKGKKAETEGTQASTAPDAPPTGENPGADVGGWTRGGSPQGPRGRGRGRGRGGLNAPRRDLSKANVQSINTPPTPNLETGSFGTASAS